MEVIQFLRSSQIIAEVAAGGGGGGGGGCGGEKVSCAVTLRIKCPRYELGDLKVEEKRYGGEE